MRLPAISDDEEEEEEEEKKVFFSGNILLSFMTFNEIIKKDLMSTSLM